MQKQPPYVMFIVGRMNPPTPGHVEGLVIPFLRKVRQQAIQMLSCKDCLADEDNRWCVPGEQLPGHCFKYDEIDTAPYPKGLRCRKASMPHPDGTEPSRRELACSNERTIISSPEACDSVDLTEMSFEDLIDKANIRVRIYLTNTTNETRLAKPEWKDPDIAEKIKEDGVNSLLENKPESEGVDDNYYVKYFYLENPIGPIEKKSILTDMIVAALDKEVNTNIRMSKIMVSTMIVTGRDSGEGPYCANRGIKSAVECSQLLQIKDNPRDGIINPCHIILVMGAEEDASESKRREKFCFKGDLVNDETTKIRCESLERVSIGNNTGNDYEDAYWARDRDGDTDPIQFSEGDSVGSSMSASKVRLMVSNGDDEGIHNLYSGYLEKDRIDRMIRSIRKGLYLKGTLLPISDPGLQLRRSARIAEQSLPLGQRQSAIYRLRDKSNRAGATFWNEGWDRAYSGLKLGEAEMAMNQVSELGPIPEEERVTGGRRRKKTRRKNKKKKKTRKNKGNKKRIASKRVASRRRQIGCNSRKKR